MDGPKKFNKKTKNPVQIFWDDLFNKRADEQHQVEYVVNKIVDTIIFGSNTYIKLDSKREFSKKQKLLKYNEQDGKCFYCKKELQFSEAIGDHKIPHSKGGTTDIDNCIITCDGCNQEKGTSSHEEHTMILFSRKQKKHRNNISSREPVTC